MSAFPPQPDGPTDPGHDPIRASDVTEIFRGSEFAGACFDPTGRYLFVNIQTPGVTFAITGPWGKGVFGGPGHGWW